MKLYTRNILKSMTQEIEFVKARFAMISNENQ